MEKIIIQIQKEICSHYYCSISVSTYHLPRHYNIRPDSHCSYDLQLGLKAFPGLAIEIMIKKIQCSYSSSKISATCFQEYSGSLVFAIPNFLACGCNYDRPHTPSYCISNPSIHNNVGSNCLIIK